MSADPGNRPAAPTAAPARPTSLRTRFRTRITAGMILVVPIWVTFLLVSFVFGMLRDTSLWMLEGLFLSSWGSKLVEDWGIAPEDLERLGTDVLPVWLRWAMGFIAVIFTISVIYLLGGLATNIVGRRLISAIEKLVDRLPLVKTIYRVSKQVLEVFAGDATRGLQRVCLVPFPNQQVRSVGFVTSVTVDRASGQEYCAVFLATTPNPTTGFLFLVKRSDLIELDWTTDDAIKAIMSGGILLGDSISLAPAKDKTAYRGGAESAEKGKDSPQRH